MECLDVKVKTEQPGWSDESYQYELPDLDTSSAGEGSGSQASVTGIHVKEEPNHWAEDGLSDEYSRGAHSNTVLAADPVSVDDAATELHIKEELVCVKTFDYDVIKQEVHYSESIREDGEEHFSSSESSSEENDDSDDVTWGETGNVSRKRKIAKNSKRQTHKKGKSKTSLRRDNSQQAGYDKSSQSPSQVIGLTKQYGCEYCEEVFVVKSELIEHKKKHTQQIGSKQQKQQSQKGKKERNGAVSNGNICFNSELKKDCELKGSKRKRSPSPNHNSRNSESKIVITNTELDKESNRCTVCDKLLISKFHLEKHMKTHNPEGRNFKCDICPSYFKDRHDLKHHVNSHLKLKPFKCEHCGKSFSRSNILNKHVARAHPEVADGKAARMVEKIHNNPLACEICDVIFCKIGNLQRHQANVHGGSSSEKYKCGHCDRTFGRIDILKKHIARKHTSGQTFCCEFCGKTFPCLEYVALHMERMHTNCKKNAPGEIMVPPYRCDECLQRFMDEKTLMRHCERHHSSNQTKYPCSQCERYFFRVELLRDHEAKHAGVQRHQCALCECKYTARDSLVRHVKTVHAESHEYLSQISSKRKKSVKKKCDIKMIKSEEA